MQVPPHQGTYPASAMPAGHETGDYTVGGTHDVSAASWSQGNGQVHEPHIPLSMFARGRTPTPAQTSMSHLGAAYGVGPELT
eukprot:7370559-Prorocentrum_lima.AAC.1